MNIATNHPDSLLNKNPSIPSGDGSFKTQLTPSPTRYRYDSNTGARIPRTFIRELLSIDKTQLSQGNLIIRVVNYPGFILPIPKDLAAVLAKSIPPDPLIIMISDLTSDLPESLSTLIAEIMNFKGNLIREDSLLNVFISALVFSGPLILTSFLRGTGTHVGYAIDVKPLLQKDAHHANLSPLYNARIEFLKTLQQWQTFIEALNVVMLVEENHIHIHKASTYCTVLPPGIYCKMMFNSKYNNDPLTVNLIHQIEGIKGKFNQTVLPIAEYIDNFQKSGLVSMSHIFPRSF